MVTTILPTLLLTSMKEMSYFILAHFYLLFFFCRSTLPQFMRPEFIPSGDKLQLAEDLNAHHASHIGMPSTEAKSQYLKIYSKWKWAEASFFLVHVC